VATPSPSCVENCRPNALPFSGLGAAEPTRRFYTISLRHRRPLQRLVRPRLHGGMDINHNWSHIVSMKTIAAAKFKEQCLSILDHLEPEGLVITKHGKPVARILPAGRASADLIGAFRGRIRVKGDIQSTGVSWEAHG